MKNTIIKGIGLALLLVAGNFVIDNAVHSSLASIGANHLAVDTVNGGDSAFVAQHSYTFIQQHALHLWYLIMGIITLITFRSDLKNIGKVAPIALMAFMVVSCKPYQTPIYKEVKNNETAFVIPLEGDVGNQAKFGSKEELDKHKVATKRIEIPTRWDQQGRGNSDGQWIPTVTVIIVDRSPVTRNWESGPNGTSKQDQAIWVESSDSVGFSMGFNCTAFIKEEDTAAFLYWYSSGSLSTVMDSEVRGRVQQIAAEESAKLPLDVLRDKKNEIAASVRADIIPFFEKRGITITTVGMFGGMTYVNPDIQKSIDGVFVAQQQKNVALAKYDAQKKENERVILEAEGIAKQREIQSNAEAKAIEALTQAVAKGGENYLQLKALEVQSKQVEKWDGRLPTVSSGALPLLDTTKFIK